MAEPIIVTGAPRSGLAIVTGVLHACGGWVSPSVRPVRGQRPFSNDVIFDTLVRPFMKGIGADPRCQDPLPTISQCRERAPTVSGVWRTFAERAMAAEGFNGDGRRAWVYTGADACLLWPIWHAAFPNARWIIVRRQAEHIARSCLKTGYMTAFGKERAWREWAHSYRRRFLNMHDDGLTTFLVWPEKMLAGDVSEMRKLIDRIPDLEWSQSAVEQALFPSLWKRGVYTIRG